MVVVSHKAALNQFLQIKPCKPTSLTLLTSTPEIDLSHPDSKALMVNACQDFGFFKLVNHGVPLDLMTKLENEAIKFFRQPQQHKDMAGPPDPFGYGSKRIGTNGDVGWVEYLLLNTNPDVISPKSQLILHQYPQIFSCAMEEYIWAVKEMCCEVLEKMAEGLGSEERNVFSRLVRDERSDSCFRVNHYPAEAEAEKRVSTRNLVGFGEHTDPQIISVLRSNNTSGLQICLKDGTWVSIPPDHTSLFIILGDLLQVMTNGRFKSVKHRVIADTTKSRVSMIYFGGPPLSEKIAPLLSLLSSNTNNNNEEKKSLYKEFTWWEYKNAAYKSRLADNRLSLFEK